MESLLNIKKQITISPFDKTFLLALGVSLLILFIIDLLTYFILKKRNMTISLRMFIKIFAFFILIKYLYFLSFEVILPLGVKFLLPMINKNITLDYHQVFFDYNLLLILLVSYSGYKKKHEPDY